MENMLEKGVDLTESLREPLNLPPLFNFERLKENAVEDPKLKAMFTTFGGEYPGICWALALVNASSILERESMSPEELKQHQKFILKRVLRVASVSWTNYSEYRKEVLKNRLDVPIDAQTGGFSVSALHPFPSRVLNGILKNNFRLRLDPMNYILTKEYPDLFNMIPGEPYLFLQRVVERGEVTGHSVTAVRSGVEIVFFEPNNVDVIQIPLGAIEPSRPIYGIPGSYHYLDYESLPLLVSQDG